MRVGFIGIGTMGRPMATRLLAAGHDVTACDIDPRRAEALGTRIAGTPAEAADCADVVITSLPSPEAVEDVVLGPDGVASAAPRGALLLEMSTSPPALARRLAARLEGSLAVLDAPVSGGPHGAEAGTLTIMVGGPATTFARAEPLLGALGRHVVHVGDHGAGQAAKLCNNLVAGATIAALGEACAVAVREGIDPATLYGLQCSAHVSYGPGGQCARHVRPDRHRPRVRQIHGDQGDSCGGPAGRDRLAGPDRLAPAALR